VLALHQRQEVRLERLADVWVTLLGLWRSQH
jgi:hypothetical protein